jgi:hypothetical protein
MMTNPEGYIIDPDDTVKAVWDGCSMANFL